MRRLIMILPAALSLAVAATMASSVSLPVTFSGGQTLTATDLNSNFSAVKTAVDDNAGRVAALENSRPGVEFTDGTSTSLPTDGSVVEVARTTVTAPAAGYVLVEASGYFAIGHVGGATSLARTSVSDSATPSITFLGAAQHGMPSGAAGGTYKAPLSGSHVFSVASAGTYTFYLYADLFYIGSGGNATVYHPFLHAVYLPARY